VKLHPQMKQVLLKFVENALTQSLAESESQLRPFEINTIKIKGKSEKQPSGAYLGVNMKLSFPAIPEGAVTK
jgi:hypothetical protein